MLKPSLQLRVGQQLTMTPQLQLAIRLLQLSSIELKAEIQNAFESNPMLETEEDQIEDTQNIDSTKQVDDNAVAQEVNEIDALPDELPIDSQWDDIYEPGYIQTSNKVEDYSDYLQNQSSEDINSLQQHLEWQLELSSLSNQDRIIANTLIDALDDSGYLSEELESIHGSLIKNYEIELDEVEAVLKFVQRLDPIGSGARSLQECLDIQLQQMSDSTPFLTEARTIVNKHLDLIASKDYKQLAKLSKFSKEQIDDAIALIQTLYPRPGDLISSQKPEYIVPDVYVDKYNGIWRVKLNSESIPKLRISDMYSGLIKSSNDNNESDYLRNQLQEARWFIKSLQSRNETLMRVATSIVKHQRSFFEYGEEAMKPLVLRDIAEELGMHESTISRVTTNKYFDSPRGILEFKYFFSSHVNTNDGGICSATAIRAMIKKLINEENHTKPLSDNKIASLLEQKGISVARRTVAKYRESMAILPSNERRQYA